MSAVSKADLERLHAAARAARAHAYAPYSRYRVGAAILTRRGTVFTGCNVENATYGATVCAERNAVGAMVAAGESDPVACVVVTGGPRPGSPCGICRQVLSELASPDMKVVLYAEGADGADAKRAKAAAGGSVATTLGALLPMAFRLRGPGSVTDRAARGKKTKKSKKNEPPTPRRSRTP